MMKWLFRGVALFTRAWIEIVIPHIVISAVWSPSLRGRGLKSMTEYEEEDIKLSPSLRGRGLKYKAVNVLSSPLGRPLYEGVD